MGTIKTILIFKLLFGATVFLSFITLSNPCQAQKNKLIPNTLDRQFQKTIKLKYDFEIKVGQKENFGTFETYSLFVLNHFGKTIFVDTSKIEYEFGDKLYPIINSINKETYEILVEVNDRPSKNYLNYIKIVNDKIIDTKKLPTFIGKAANLDNDPNLEYAGIWDFGEVWGTNNDTTAYNPIIYYKITPKGILLDSLLTKERNKYIYGRFMGFNYSEKNAVSIKMIDVKFKKELERISRACR